ncbi:MULTISPECIES: hypothetical protein [Streptomyces]
MPASAHAAFPAAEHPEPQPAAAGALPRGGGHSIKVPLRLVVGAQYADTALSVYVKIAALSQRAEGCTAKVSVIARYLGMSKSAAERGLGQLVRPDVIDGLVEIPTVRRTLPGGRGQSAHRITRDLADGELWVRIPVRAAEVLSPRLLRLYALLAYASARRIPVTAAELGQQLHHHTGRRAGEHLGERQARRLVDALEATGWLSVHRREGQHGRHAYETHRHPLRSVPAPAATEPVDEQLPLWGAESPVIHDGSGPGDHDGSLASEEDLSTDRPVMAQVVGGIRRRRSDRKWAPLAVDNSVPDTFGPGNRVLRTDEQTPSSSTAPDRAPYTGPGLQLSPRIWRVLEPVRHELPQLRTFVLRQLARAIGAQLNTGADEERLRERITRCYATTTTIRDMGRWLVGAAIVRHGCGMAACESGTVWETGEPCETCVTNAAVRKARAVRAAELAAGGGPSTARPRELEHGQAQDEEQQARRAASQARQQLLAELGPDGTLPRPRRAEPAAAGPAPPGPWPARATAAERAAATPDDVATAIARHGRAAAIHQYGHALVRPHLLALDLPETGS